MARIQARLRMNFYPLPEGVAEQMGRRLTFEGPCSILDPCAGEGRAFVAMTRHARGCRRYGIELDAYRAEEAAKVLDFVVQGDTLSTRSKVESFSLIFCNPPFGFTEGEQGTNQRLEKLFTAHVARWLVSGGILILTLARERLADCARTLAYHFTDLRVYRLEAPECERYRQIVVFARAKTRREREKTRDHVITQTQGQLSGLVREPGRIQPLCEANLLPVIEKRRFLSVGRGPAL